MLNFFQTLLIFSFVLHYFSILAIPDYDYEDICSFINGDSGDCIPLKECKPLLRLIKNRPLLKKNLGLLVNLTCEFHIKEPKVCCPVDEDAVYQDNDNQSTHENIPIIRDHRIIKRPLFIASEIHDPSFRDHKNFGKIPSFEKCSLSLSSYLRKAQVGKETFRGQFPWIALLGYRNSTSGKIDFLCGGTVINKRNILTSAQCTDIPGYGSPTIVRLAEHDLATDPDCIKASELGCSSVQEIPIERITVHQGFNFTAARKLITFKHDIAVIGLANELIFDIYVQPVCLPFIKDYDLVSFPKRLDSVSAAYSAGWQNVFWKSPQKSLLELSTFPIKHNEECEVYFPKIQSTQICGGSIVRTECRGNVGSALMIAHTERSMSKYFQIGITSYGPFHCRVNPIPGLFTRVSSYLEFILDSIL